VATSAGVAEVWPARWTAAAPATCGVAIDVPEMVFVAVPLVFQPAVMEEPGRRRPGRSRSRSNWRWRPCWWWSPPLGGARPGSAHGCGGCARRARPWSAAFRPRPSKASVIHG
jgi:hypothetical protein